MCMLETQNIQKVHKKELERDGFKMVKNVKTFLFESLASFSGIENRRYASLCMDRLISC